MKILITGQTYFRRDNGQAVFTINLAEGLAQAGHQVMVIAPSETRRPYRRRHGHLCVQTVPALPLGYNLNISGLSEPWVEQSMADFAPQIVHIQDHYFLSRSVLSCARRRQLPVVGTNHFLPDNVTDNLRVSPPLRPLLNRVLWRTMLDVYNRLDAVTAPTQTGVAILQAQQLIPPVLAVSNGVDQTRFHPRPALDRMAVRRKYGLAEDRAMLLYVGRIDREKCLDVVVQALTQCPCQAVQFVIAGKGTYRQELAQLCQQLGLEQKVVFTGFVPDADLPLLLNSADAFVMPSHAELQSIATLEAMSSGLPVLAANARALPELVKADVNGYLFVPHDVADAAQQITTLLDNRARWAEMGQASLQRVAPHAHARTIEHYLKLYTETRPSAYAKRRTIKPLLESYAATAQIHAAALVFNR